MALDLTPEQKEAGKANFQRVADGLKKQEEGGDGVTRRQVLRSLAYAGGVAVPLGAAAYFHYSADKVEGSPVKAALIGAGDEGGVLAGEHNPRYLEIVAVCDIRPSNQKRIFRGEPDKPTSPRKGLNFHYGRNADKTIKVYDDVDKVLERKDIEAVVIALPLHLHAPVAIKAMRAGKHVLCEKLMAWNIGQCKKMIQVANETDRILSIGHQRHYSMLYAHAYEVLNSGVLGDVRHIRALWHRNNTLPATAGKDADRFRPDTLRDSWRPKISEEDRLALASGITTAHDYKSMEELVRWRLYNRTGGGLMAELGSHQLDACSIFLGKVHPLSVTGVGGKLFYKDDREVEDHVFVTFEFPGKDYAKDRDDKVVVTYSSISTNAFEQYGECVMGTRGTLLVEGEKSIYLYPLEGRAAQATVTTTASGKPALDSGSSPGGGGPAVKTPAAGGTDDVSRGYREEMEHFAYCVRMHDQGMSKEDRPHVRCDGVHAMADAIIALTSNKAMREGKRIKFKEKWFSGAPEDMDEVPDADMKAYHVNGKEVEL
jgi:predicted dehydrogenase